MYLFKTISAIINAAACLVLNTQPARVDYQSVLMGEWRKYDTEGTYLLYEKYVFKENSEALYSERYIDDQELNKETRVYRLSGDILTIGLAKLVGQGKTYYIYRIISLTRDEMVLQLLSKYYSSEPEKWKRPGSGPLP
jgi:hypothetical protein